MYLVALAVWVLAAPAVVTTQSASSPDVKAAFLINFARFVTWPQTLLPDGRDLVIGVIGSNAVADALTRLARGKSIDGHRIVVTRHTGDDPATAHMLFISDDEGGRIPELIKRVGASSVLTVSDSARFCVSGGIIQLRHDDDRIGFDINLDRAQAAGLVLSSKLLTLAWTVHPAKR